MIRLDGGEFTMGSNDFYREEMPPHRREVGAFWIDRHPVTVADFGRFVADTGHVTVAERAPDPSDYPGVDPAALVAGGLVFAQPKTPVPLNDWQQWWAYLPGAHWRQPFGADANRVDLQRHPVTQVGVHDAQAYAAWAGKELPTEAEWEYAARGGHDGRTFSWGDEFAPGGQRMANTWIGAFPTEFVPERRQTDRPGTTAVGRYPPNDYGLYDMAGNVWEWTADEYTDDHSAATSCCAPVRPRAARSGLIRNVIKGGSFLCAPNYCLRYRPAARQAQDSDTSTCHLGFRCVIRD
ncbi:formylglycine-generating enzyme family protein [Gordonia sp. TBRC 11910]|uniref:Formylglycine-generating enzyme family protein n=1 Tax=Gordonia asplenii TaxID=2725283 RepID=A0A848L222_9ACTN|nr:formylglycine-generating enzyme family protein [Gordonia asplenii]NMO03135.1 formylglycine-generating enzyme family protein [Gordonia asplenii]